jgi:hypothetical protein
MSKEFDYVDDFERLFDQNYLRWFHLEGEPALVEIVSVTREELTLRGGAVKKSPVIALKLIQGKIKLIKPLVMNRTNMDSIVDFLGRRPSEWAGKQMVLFQDTTKLKGQTVPCIRVRKPKSPPTKETT